MDRSCKKCGKYIPYKIKIDDKWRNLKNRKFCLACSPWQTHNTRDITKPKVWTGKKKTTAAVVTKYRRRLKWRLVEYKGGKCEICGYNKVVPGAYDFHHSNPLDKEFEIAAQMSKSWDILVKEVDKCKLLCRNCHAEVHHEMISSQLGLERKT